jgi:uncharacterized membrane protein YcaP (DUF421 family)
VEIVLRAAFVFAFLWFVTRVVGKRELGQMNAFELLLLVTMGDLVQQGITQEDYSVTGAVLAVGTFAVLSVGLSYVSWRWQASRKLIEGAPVVVVRDGKMLGDVMRYERLPSDELLEAMRQEGIRDLRNIDIAVLEPNGTYSFFRKEEGSG